MKENQNEIVMSLLKAALVLGQEKSRPQTRAETAVQSLTSAQSDIAEARVKLIRASRAINDIEPLIRKKSSEEVGSIQAFRHYYGELSEKLNNLVGSIARVNAELMDVVAGGQTVTPQPPPQAEQPQPPAQPAAKR